MRPPAELDFSRKQKLPVIRSAEAAECGLACITMIARFHGHDVDINGLRQRFPIAITGTTFRNLVSVADRLGLATRAVRVELDALGLLRLPAILHWDLKHFVVLKSVTKGVAVIHDPAGGVRQYRLDQVSQHFTGVALELEPTASFEKVVANVPVRLSSLWTRINGFGPSVAKVLALSLALQLVAFVLPLQSQLVVDQGILRNDQNLVLTLALGFGALVLLQAGIEALRSWTIQVFSQLMSFQMVANVFRHMLRLPSDYFEKRQVGDIISRVASATSIQDIITKGIVAAFIDGAMSVLALAAMLVYSPILAAIVVGATAINLGASLVVLPLMRGRMNERILASAREQSHVMETVRAATTVKLMGREAEREGAWRNLYANVINASVSVAKYDIALAGFQTITTGLQIVLVFYAAANLVIGGSSFTLGMLFAFLSFRQTFSDRANSIVNQIVQFRLLRLHLERVGDIIAAEPEPTTHAAARDGFDGAIDLSGVSFRYGVGDPLVLDGVDLSVKPGEFIAITGRSGGGKSTLLKVMLGLRPPTDGTILLDGKSATPELWRAWRESVGVVAQDDRLISGSIADNIGFFDPDLDMKQVEAAARAANIHDEIIRLPMQYFSPIGDMGSSLSGGQRQRVLLARALYRQPRILFLDEGTANLDEHTEAAICDLVAGMPVTRIVIAHRPALLGRADRVLDLRGGRLNAFTRPSPEHARAANAPH